MGKITLQVDKIRYIGELAEECSKSGSNPGLIMIISFLFFLVFAFFSFLNSFFFHDLPIFEGLAFFLIAIISSAIIFLHPISSTSLLKVYFVFTYLFFSVVPVVEIGFSKVYWGGMAFERGQYLQASIVVLILSVIVYFSYLLVNKTKFDSRLEVMPAKNIVIGRCRALVLLLISLSCFLVALQFNSFNIYSLLIRGGELVERNRFESGPVNLIYGSVIRFLPLATAIVLLLKVRGSRALKAALITIGILCAFPASIARLSVPTYYFPLLFVMFPPLMYYSKMVLLLLVGILFVFPFLNNFREFSFDKEMNYSMNYDFLIAGHFDAFQNFARIISINFVTYGEQLLGALLFFVPRSVWAEKPIGTGHRLASEASYDFGNISATWYAEGWANFGLLGSVLFAIIIGVLMGKLDKNFWTNNLSDYMKVIYLFLIGYLFFLLRGDLLSASAYLVGTIVAVSVPYFIVMGGRKI